MTRSKLGLLGLCAVVLGMFAISTSSAQAALSWLILDGNHQNPKELKAVVLGEIDSSHLTLLTKLSGLMISITCTAFATENLNLEAGGTLTTGFTIVYTGCEAYSGDTLGTALNCGVHSSGTPVGTLLTNELKGILVLHEEGGQVLTKIEPKTGTVLLLILTSECVLPEDIPVNGVVYVKDCEGKATTHTVKHLVEQGPLTSLWVGKHTVEHLETSIRGSGWTKLGGAHLNLQWAAMDA